MRMRQRLAGRDTKTRRARPGASPSYRRTDVPPLPGGGMEEQTAGLTSNSAGGQTDSRTGQTAQHRTAGQTDGRTAQTDSRTDGQDRQRTIRGCALFTSVQDRQHAASPALSSIQVSFRFNSLKSSRGAGFQRSQIQSYVRTGVLKSTILYLNSLL